MNTDQSAMCYISMHLTWQALQTDEKLFSNFEFLFSNQLQFFSNNAGVGFMHPSLVDVYADQHAF